MSSTTLTPAEELAHDSPPLSLTRLSPGTLVATAARTLRAVVPVRRPRFLRGPHLEHVVRAPVLTTTRLTLRPHRLSDAEQWYRIQSDQQVLRFLPWPQRTRAESLRHLRHRTHHTRLNQSGDFLALAIEHNGELVGDVSLHLRKVNEQTRSVEIGWLLATDATGKGLASEAATALIAFAFSAVRAHSVIAVMAEANQASLRLATGLGFAELDLHEGRRTMVLQRG